MASEMKREIDELNEENLQLIESIKCISHPPENCPEKILELAEISLELLRKRAERNNRRLTYLCRAYPIAAAKEDEKIMRKITRKVIARGIKRAIYKHAN